MEAPVDPLEGVILHRYRPIARFCSPGIVFRPEDATRINVMTMRQETRGSVPCTEPATFEFPPARERYGSGISRMRKP